MVITLSITIQTLTKNTKPVSEIDVDVMLNYYDGYFKNRKYSRFDMALSWLSNHKKVPRFYTKFINGCLCILKKQSFGVPYLWLIVPPMHINGDLKIEKEVLEIFKNHGVNCRLSEEDIKLYGYKENIERRKKFDEFIYCAGDYDDLSGKKMKRHRYRLNRFYDAEKLNIVKSNRVGSLTSDLFVDCDNLINRWKKQTGNSVNGMHKELHDTASMLYITDFKTGKVVAISVCEKINKHVIGVTGYHDYDYKRIKKLDNIIHYLECQHWSKLISNKTTINLGMGDLTDGLLNHKRELNPIKVLEIYSFKKVKKITWDEWRESCKQNKLTLNNERLW